MTKPLILAIEPDPLQGAQLSSMAARLGAELVLTETTPAGIEVLGARLPDLILTPALLSLRDDLALTARLRELGAAADHIQTLTIPILETAEPAVVGGVLSAPRRNRIHGQASTGCDADTFAEQIQVYLERAVAMRDLSLQQGPPPGPPEAAPAPPGLERATADAVVMCDVSDWSYFDPTESRFVALLGKLDDIAERKA